MTSAGRERERARRLILIGEVELVSLRLWWALVFLSIGWLIFYMNTHY